MKKNSSLRISKDEMKKSKFKVSRAETVGDKTENSDTNSLYEKEKPNKEQM